MERRALRREEIKMNEVKTVDDFNCDPIRFRDDDEAAEWARPAFESYAETHHELDRLARLWRGDGLWRAWIRYVKQMVAEDMADGYPKK